MTRSGAPARRRASRDPYGIGPIGGVVGPAVAGIALILIGIFTWNLLQGSIPFVSHGPTPDGQGGDGPGAGAAATPAPPGVVLTDPKTSFPGSIAYAKAGSIWIQTGAGATQLTKGESDSMPSISADGKWIYFIQVNPSIRRFPTGGFQSPSWYDLDTPSLFRMHLDGSGAENLLTATFKKGSSAWFYWLRQPVPNPNGKTVVVISDGPNPLQSDIVVKSFNLTTKKLASLNQPESLALGHQDPVWSPDGHDLVYVKNGRGLTGGAPQLERYDTTTKKTTALTGTGYVGPAFSPDGAWIAATKTSAFGTDVAILDRSGKEVLRVTDDGHSFSPAWSPAGDAIAFLHLQGTIVDLKMATLDRATGRWAVSATVDLTRVSGLDGGSRPSWWASPADVPRPSPAAGGAAPSVSTTP